MLQVTHLQYPAFLKIIWSLRISIFDSFEKPWTAKLLFSFLQSTSIRYFCVARLESFCSRSCNLETQQQLLLIKYPAEGMFLCWMPRNKHLFTLFSKKVVDDHLLMESELFIQWPKYLKSEITRIVKFKAGIQLQIAFQSLTLFLHSQRYSLQLQFALNLKKNPQLQNCMFMTQLHLFEADSGCICQQFYKQPKAKKELQSYRQKLTNKNKDQFYNWAQLPLKDTPQTKGFWKWGQKVAWFDTDFFLNNLQQRIEVIMRFQQILLLFFVHAATAATYNFNTTSISIETLSSGNIGNSTSLDTCSKLIIRPSQVYHLSSKGIYRGWLKNDLQSPTSNLTLSSLISSVQDFDVTSDQSNLVFYIFSLLGLANNKAIYSINSQHVVSSVSSQNQLKSPIQTFITANYTYDFYGPSSSLLQPSIEQRNQSTNSIVNSISASNIYRQMAVSPDHQIGVVWSSATSCIFYNLTSMVQIGSYSPAVIPNPGATNSISFSQDSKYALIEADDSNPIAMISLSSFSVVKQISVKDKIAKAQFLDSMSTILVVFGSNALLFVNLTSNQQYSVPPLQSSVGSADQQYNLFSCSYNLITQYHVTFKQLDNNTTNQTNSSGALNSSTTNSSTTQNKHNHQNNIDNKSSAQNSSMESPFYNTIILNEIQKRILDSINKTLVITIHIANSIGNVAASSPLAIYFLSFLNYITVSSLYVLLNFPIPQHIYNYLILITTDESNWVLNMLGIDWTVPMFSDQKISQQKALYFGLSSDILTANFSKIVEFVVSILIILFFALIVKEFMNGKNPIKFFLMQESWNMLYGQIIGLMQPFILPWSFILLYGGVENIQTKLNSAIFSLLFQLFLVFLFYYLKQLLRLSKKYSGKPVITETKQPKLKIEWLGTTKFRLVKANPQKKFTLLELINTQLLQNWYLCLTNFIFPLLVLLENPIIFLVAILFYDIFGTLIAFKRKRKRLNKIILSLYPLIFHCCFMIFYWCKSLPIVSTTEIVCLIVLLLGIIHNLAIVIFDLLVVIKRFITKCFQTNKVSPQATSKVFFKTKRSLTQHVKPEKKQLIKTERVLRNDKNPQDRHKKEIHFQNNPIQYIFQRQYVKSGVSLAIRSERNLQYEKKRIKVTNETKRFKHLIIQ